MKAGSVIKACLVFSIGCFNIFNGLLISAIWLLIVIISTPVYAYRFFISQLASRYYNKSLGKIVTPSATLLAVEFLPCFKNRSPKCIILVTLVHEGKVSVQEMRKFIEERWLPNGTQNAGFPELQQYVEPWKGFLFWKKDLNFSIDHHVKSYKIESFNSNEMDKDIRCISQKLLNKPFLPKRSPWEWFVVENYNIDRYKGECKNGEMTLHLFRFHHCLGDGYSMSRAIIEKLAGNPIEAALLPTPWRPPALRSCIEKFMAALYFSIQLLLDMKLIEEVTDASLIYSNNTPLHAPDDGGLLYEKHEILVPITQIKEIKNKLGGTFTGVLLTAISAGIGKLLQNKNKSDQLINNVKLFVPLPLPGYPTELGMHVTATCMNLPTAMNLHPIQRLEQVEERLKKARRSTVPLLYSLFSLSMGSLFPNVAKYFIKNRFAPVGLTNFPGPAVQLKSFNGKKALLVDFISGTLIGATGVFISVFSFRGYIRISAACSDRVMNTNEVQAMLSSIVDEIHAMNKI